MSKNRGVDKRVIRLNEPKVFSCIEAAAYATQQTKRDIELVCTHYGLVTEKKDRFMFYYEYCDRMVTNGKAESIIPQNRKPIVEIPWVENELEAILRRKKNPKNYFIMVRMMYEALTEFIDDSDLWGTDLTLWDIHHIFLSYVHRESPDFDMSVNRLALHFKSCRLSYERILGMEIRKIYSERSHRTVFGARFRRIEGMSPEKVGTIPKEVIDATPLRRSSIPVINLLGWKRYGSVYRAAHDCGVNSEVIKFCCEGDIESIYKMDGSELRFRYLKYIKS